MRLRVHQLPRQLLLPVTPTLALLRAVVEPLLRILDGNDVLFAPGATLRARHLPSTRAAVATIHDLGFVTMPSSIAPESLGELRRRLAFTLFHAQRLIAVSDATAEDLCEHLHLGRHRVHTVHEGLDPLFDVAELEPDAAGPELPDRYLLFVSALEPRKNVSAVLAAFRLLVEWGYPGDLVLVGAWQGRSEGLRRELAASPARDRIVHLEHVDRSSMPAVYRAADALVLPSWIEGFGLPLLEAMASGTPVVTSGRSAMPEVAGPAAVYIDPDRPHSIASAVAALLEDRTHRQRLVKLGRERARRFSWQSAAGATAQVLRQAAGLEATGPDEYRVDQRSNV
jgi:alpha-1,3-rhamnosyl/mannosyltransferase